MISIKINGEKIKLDQFLKWANISESGGHSKILIVNGEIKVNGIVETKRGRQLSKNDVITYKGKDYIVE